MSGNKRSRPYDHSTPPEAEYDVTAADLLALERIRVQNLETSARMARLFVQSEQWTNPNTPRIMGAFITHLRVSIAIECN